MKNQAKNTKQVAIFQGKSGAIEVRLDGEHETLLMTQQQVAEIFNVQKAAISKHVKNIFDSGELSEKATVSKMETVQLEGKRSIKRTLEYYNLDLVISIGYRVNSKQATSFRQWATKTLKQHITKGFTVNPVMIEKNYEHFMEVVHNIKHLMPSNAVLDTNGVLELLAAFADTWLSLDAYDKDSLKVAGETRKTVELTTMQLQKALGVLRSELIKQGEADEQFGLEKDSDAVAEIVASVMQSFAGRSLYPTVEEKAANLFYYLVKKTPFIDGNKRSGAFAFVWYLKKAGLLDNAKITPPALTALTLFIAESEPKNKNRMIQLILQLLKK
ncbi:MAG: virulence protein RhuM/Fic/DOC family protein [bacterium]